MPFRDHFRPPVNDTHSWDEVHGQWPGEMVRHLTTLLPPGFRAGPRVHLGSSFAVDIGTYELEDGPPAPGGKSGGGTATLTAPSPTLTVDADLAEYDEYEVRVYDTERDRQLVAAIEIVSPANKDRSAARYLFTGKCAALLQQGVCVTVVDPVTVRAANLYADLLARLDRADPHLGPTPPATYAVTLRTRPLPRGRTLLDAWHYPLAVGEPLPEVPVWLGEELRILLSLETSYEETCRVLGIT
jgi:hypothetical protein